MVNIGLVERNRSEVCQVLNTLLADEFLLSTKTKNYHWNVTGLHFHDLHQLLGEQYAKLDLLIDQIAERVRVLDNNALGTMMEFLRFTRLEEHPYYELSDRGMVEELCDDHETLIRALRKILERNADIYCDAGTTDLLTTVMQHDENMAWMLRSVLGQKSHLKQWVKNQEQTQRENGVEISVANVSSGDKGNS
jgi:starvation-inducible DNA-binding protein